MENKKNESSYEKARREHFEKFLKTVPSSSDAVTMILRCHLLAEYYLDKVIELKIPRGDIITDSRFQFSEKILIVEAIDIINKNLLDTIKKLNKIRNSCSHVISYDITEEDIEKLRAPLKLKPVEYKNKKDSLHGTLLSIMAQFAGTIQGLTDMEKTKNKIN